MHIFVALLLVAEASMPLAPNGGAIDSYVEQKVRDHLAPGAAVMIVRNGAEVHSRGFGKAGAGRKMDVDTPVVIGSLSKMFTATAVLQLVDQKKIELDAPVQKYLPEFTLADREAAAAITVRDLLNHTSGLSTAAPRATNDNASLRDHVLALAKVSPVAPRGSRHIYSSPNYQVLGLLVERISGLPFGDYLQRNIFAPLGMTRSFTDIDAARRAAVAPGHNIWFGMALPSSYKHEPDRLPTASIITTARDLSRFLASHLGVGPQLLSPASLEAAHRGAAEGNGFKYAMGFREGKTAGVKSLWHGGALPSYRGAVVMLPDTKTSIVVLTNSASMFADHTREIASGIVSLMHGRQPRRMFRPLRQTYLVVAVVAALFVLLQIRGVVRALRVQTTRRVVLKVVLLDILVPVAVLLLLPRMTKISWQGMYEGAPDILSAMVFILVVSVVTGFLRLMRKEVIAPTAADARFS